MKRLLAQRERSKPALVGGVAIDSDYVIFVIDTSDSMRDHVKTTLKNQMREILTVYPQLKGLQILNDALYDHDRGDAPIPSAVRELKLEKRDGGLQIAAHLRVGAAESVALEALTIELHRAGFGDIVVRPAAAPVPVQKPAATLHAR